MAQTNLDIVKTIYAAFQRGDIPSILNLVNDQVDWKNPGGPDVPYAGERRNKTQVAEFFRILGESVEVLGFEPRSYTADGDQVGAFGHFRARARATNKEFGYDWAMSWRLKDGKVTGYQAYVDTATESAAFRKAAGA